MEKLVTHSEYAEFIYEPNLLVMRFLKDKKEMSEASYRQELTAWLEHVKDIQPRTSLVDTRYFTFTIEPETQLWVANEIMPEAVKNGLIKLAFLIPSDIFAQVSIEQTMEETDHGSFQSAHFDEEELAREWLKA